MKDATKYHNKSSQETLAHFLNQIKNINSKIDGMGQKKDVYPKFCVPLRKVADNSKMINDVERFSSLTTGIVATPNEIPPMPDKL